MEDLDHPKVKPDAAEQAAQDLRWLGLDWDEGPDNPGACGPYVQSLRVPLYAQALEQLKRLSCVYPCICSRRDVESAQAAPQEGDDAQFYPGTCRGRFKSFEEAARSLEEGRLPAWRFAAPGEETAFNDGFSGPQHAQVSSLSGDFVLARHAQGAGYMLAVVVDDAAMGITEVLRGDDLLPATHRQMLIASALGLPSPSYIHVPLVVGPDGRRLAKRHGDTRISALRAAGIPAEKIVAWLAHSCGWALEREHITPTELIPLFTLDTVPKKPVVFSPDSGPVMD